MRVFAQEAAQGEGPAAVVVARLCDNFGAVAGELQGSGSEAGGGAGQAAAARGKGLIIEEREEQNIKRRVYDALNVLIALGVLLKDGRKITCSRNQLLKPHMLSKGQEMEQLQQ